jgi:hypothetical protein
MHLQYEKNFKDYVSKVLDPVLKGQFIHGPHPARELLLQASHLL